MRRLGSLFLLLSVLAFARHDAPGCGTTRDTAAEQMFLHRQAARARRSRPAPLASSLALADRDIGNLAIIEDSNGVVEKLNQFNLDGSTLTFTPAAPDASRYRYAASAQSYDATAAAQGTPLVALDDDDARELALPFAFPFFGATYNKVWVNSDGNLTFTAAENASSSRITGRVTGGPPRIAALFDDLDPSKTAGGVRLFADAAHAVFSWVAVPEWQQSGIGARQTFQVRLYPDGRIVFAYSGVNPASAVVGIAPGGAKGATTLVSLKNDPSGEYSAAVVERFGNSLEIDIVLVAQRFYQTHEDAYDYLVIYNNAEIGAMPGAVAYESTVRSSGSGWGAAAADNGQQYGSGSRLRSVINMGQITQYPKDPLAFVPSRGPSHDTPLTVIGHEAGHLFLANASIADPNDPAARPMLGFGGVHWSFVFNSEASLDEGEQIADRGTASPRFITSAITQGYSPLDQYLMGFLGAQDVPDTFVVTGYSSNVQPTFHPSQGIAFDGNRLNISAADVIKAEGRRTPDYTVAQRRYRFAFILVVPTGSQVPAEDVRQVETYRQQFEAFFAQASSGNAAAETTLNRSLKLSVFPAAGLIAGGTANATIAVQTAAAADLTVQLQTPKGFAQAPPTVRIPAGATSATFALTGVKSGVEELVATPLDGTYETAFARVQVSGVSQARLSAISTAPEAIVVRLSDANDLAYAGARITAAASAGGTVTPAVGVSDEQGRAAFYWSPGGAAANQLRLAVEAAPEIAVTLNAGSAVTSISAVVNAASYVRGVSPGALEALFGANLAGSKVTLNGVALPAIYASDTQINFLVPADTPLGDATIAVTTPAGAIATLNVTVTAVQPGIFGAIVKSGYVEIYCTGLGTTNQIPTVFFGATPVQPSFVGLNQINAAVPAGISGSVPLLISIGKAVSNEIKVTVP